MHFTTSNQAGESIKEPLKYYHSDSASAIIHLSATMDLGIRKLILSSTAVVYGHSKYVPKTESELVNPIKP
jgi:UDP-glucose 4-epimerase